MDPLFGRPAVRSIRVDDFQHVLRTCPRSQEAASQYKIRQQRQKNEQELEARLGGIPLGALQQQGNRVSAERMEMWLAYMAAQDPPTSGNVAAHQRPVPSADSLD
mmetsp:Transcript_17409/g.56994  ORF Transcript_17409/g.56994 Transcript_17409/m.56994 type:complete len:105 (+) Transcript_17409:236-550(+)